MNKETSQFAAEVAGLDLGGLLLALGHIEFYHGKNAHSAAIKYVSASTQQLIYGTVIEGIPGHAPSAIDHRRFKIWESAVLNIEEARETLRLSMPKVAAEAFMLDARTALEQAVFLHYDFNLQGMTH